MELTYLTDPTLRRLFMFTLTEAAKKQLDSYFADKDKSPIRVYLSSGG
jgi:Fe-S cluster assembly iron-binding protein IscA